MTAAARRYDELEIEIWRLRLAGEPPEAEKDLVIKQAALWPDMEPVEQEAAWARIDTPPKDLGLVDLPLEVVERTGALPRVPAGATP